MANPYQTLGIASGATPEEIKRAYRRLARTYHPDLNQDPHASARFQQIQAAYETLTSAGSSTHSSSTRRPSSRPAPSGRSHRLTGRLIGSALLLNQIGTQIEAYAPSARTRAPLAASFTRAGNDRRLYPHWSPG